MCDWYLVGISEMTESIKIIQQALKGIPGGSYENLEIRRFDRVKDTVWNEFDYRFIKVQAINSFSRLESLREVYGIIWVLIPIFTPILGITIGVLVIVWLEREISAGIQQRIGPEYVGPLGILQALADGTKLLFKENLLPSIGDTLIPFGYHLVIADLSIGGLRAAAQSISY
ncbi:hypothetical protein R6Q59_025033 [Mikania micrantha]